MTTPENFRANLRRHLDALAERGQRVEFWWRDDDAVEPSPALDRLLDLANRYEVEIALAVIPRDAGPALAERLADEPRVSVLQHGWSHRNHQSKPEGEKAAELGTRRDLEEVRIELAEGRVRLERLFGDRFIPALVPPWNRISPDVARVAREVGLPGLSTFASNDAHEPHRLQTHIDMIKWKEGKRFIGWASAAARFDEIFGRRLLHKPEPIGLLSHHLVHDQDHHAFLEATLSVTTTHPGARWPSVRALFGL